MLDIPYTSGICQPLDGIGAVATGDLRAALFYVHLDFHFELLCKVWVECYFKKKEEDLEAFFRENKKLYIHHENVFGGVGFFDWVSGAGNWV